MKRTGDLMVAINAQIPPGRGFGGVESVLISLIESIGRLEDGPEEYVVITRPDGADWMKTFLGPNQRMVSAARKSSARDASRYLSSPIKALARKVLQSILPNHSKTAVEVSDGFYENLGCDIIHFPSQRFVVCAMPSVFNPHDLQHIHYPEFFRPRTLVMRDQRYRSGCHFAHTIVVGSQWVKDDLVRQYNVHDDKIQVIPWAPPTSGIDKPSSMLLRKVQEKYSLKQPFAYYPAMIWEHKNHLRLIEALARLREREGLIIHLVCTGKKHDRYWPRVLRQIENYRLENQVKFLGLVPREELRAIYRLSQFVVVPTLFEAASGPIFEAWQDDIPVACSTVTSLPEQAGNAALLFNPYSVDDIADVLQKLTLDEASRIDLVAKGRDRLQDFDWDKTARAYRAVYRRSARRSLTEEDRWLLSHDWNQHSPKQ